ncbi:MAG: Glyoxalase/Bleomycin resistance protein/dioxygenase domain, partial [uncultured Actinomycetospora sp.]
EGHRVRRLAQRRRPGGLGGLPRRALRFRTGHGRRRLRLAHPSGRRDVGGVPAHRTGDPARRPARRARGRADPGLRGRRPGGRAGPSRGRGRGHHHAPDLGGVGRARVPGPRPQPRDRPAGGLEGV